MLDALKIVRPETVIRWHRAGFRAYWRWKSRPRGGRPKTPLEIRHLIREMSLANPLWGAPRIHGELLKLGILTRGSRIWRPFYVRFIDSANRLTVRPHVGASLLSDAFAPVPSPSERGFLNSSPQAEPSVQIAAPGSPDDICRN